MLRLTIDLEQPTDDDPVLEFAHAHIGDAESVTFEVVYAGHEDAPDVLTVTSEGEVHAVPAD